jgi:class 3 adenylate cyclase/uncharacterized protein HemY
MRLANLASGLLLLGLAFAPGLRAEDSLPASVEALPGLRQRADRLLQWADLRMESLPDSACLYADRALGYARSVRDRHWQGEAWLRLGRCQWQQGHYTEALAAFLDARQQFRAAGDSFGVARSAYGLAQTDWQSGNYPEALEQALFAMRLREQWEDSAGAADSYFQVGILKAELNEHEEARRWYARAEAIARARSDRALLADILHYVGRSWRKQDLFDKALEAHSASFALYQALGDSVGIADYYNNLGSIYRRQQKYALALKHFFLSLDIQSRIRSSPTLLADSYNDIGTTLSQQGRYREALPYLEKALQIARQAGLRDDIRYAYASLAANYDSLGDYRNAYRCQLLLSQVKDSLLDQQKNDELARLNVLYGSKEKERQIELLRAESKARQNFYGLVLTLAAALGLMVLAVMAFLFWRTRLQRRNNRQLAAKNRAIAEEQQKSWDLLLNILPEPIALKLRDNPHGRPPASSFPCATVMFVDFKRFTEIAEGLTPAQLVDELHLCFEAFDRIAGKYNIEKIKTIGDAYMCASGLSAQGGAREAVDVVRAGLEMQQFMKELKARRERQGVPYFEARVGISSGPLVAGVVGIKKFAYDIWGDTVNTAARMESSGEVGRVNISEYTYALVKHHFICRYRGKIPAKNKGEMEMYFVEWG